MLSFTAETPLSQVLEAHPQILDYLISLNPHEFERLRIPLIRSLVAPQISLERLSAMLEVPLPHLLAALAKIAQSPLIE